MTRVLHVATLVDDEMSYGGPVTVALNQCGELRRRGVDARLVAAWRGTGAPPRTLSDVPVHLFPARDVAPWMRFSGIVAPAMLAWLRRELGPDDVGHVHLARDLVPLLAAKVFQRRGVPYVTQTHGMVAIDPRPQARLLDRGLTRGVLRRARARLVLTREEESELSGVLDVPASSLTRLGNGVRLSATAPDPADRTGEVLFLSRLHPRKRVLDFARAAVQLLREGSPATFRIVGPDDGDLPALLELLEGAGRPAGLTYDGPLDHDAAIERLSTASIYVLPSVDEPFPMSLLEALAAGTACICTTGCALAPQLVEAGMAVVVSPGVEELVVALRTLIADSQARARLGAGAAEGVRARFSLEAVGDELEGLYARA